jgi:quinol monooxygenase YgiN
MAKGQREVFTNLNNMIIRIFRVKIHPQMREKFEAKFASISISAVNNAEGSISVTMGMPTKWAPDEYAMISHWQDENSLTVFAGENWSQPHIPQGMAKFVDKMWVHHFEGL